MSIKESFVGNVVDPVVEDITVFVSTVVYVIVEDDFVEIAVVTFIENLVDDIVEVELIGVS